MHHALVVAFAVAIGSAGISFLVSMQIRPEAATRAIATLASLSALSTLWALFLIASANIVQLHGIAEALSWCGTNAIAHRDTMTPVGGVAVIAVIAVVCSGVRIWRHQRLLRAPAGHQDLEIVRSDVPTAFALPGRPGQIVISTGMLRSLEADERRVLLAHERAHLRCHHHRYVRVTQLAAAAVPMLAPLNARVRYATERWADEEAAREVDDRAVVARAIARAAFAQTDAMGVALGIADTGVVERVEWLLADAPRRSRILELGLAGSIGAAVSGLAVSIVLVGPWVAQLLGFCR